MKLPYIQENANTSVVCVLCDQHRGNNCRENIILTFKVSARSAKCTWLKSEKVLFWERLKSEKIKMDFFQNWMKCCTLSIDGILLLTCR